MMVKAIKLKTISVLIVCIIFLQTLFPMVPASAQDDMYPYKRIPGITAEQIEAVEALRAKYSKLTCGMLESEDAFPLMSGKLGGFATLLCGKLSEMFGFDFQVEIFNWNTLNQLLNKNLISFTADFSTTPERLKLYNMSDPISQRYLCVIFNKNRPISETKRLTYAFFEGSATQDLVYASQGKTFDSVYANSVEGLVELLSNDEADGIVVDNTFYHLFSKYSDLEQKILNPTVFNSISFSTANPELAPIIEVLNLYLANDSNADDELKAFHAEGLVQYKYARFIKSLSAAELNYINSHAASGEAIPIVANYDYYPYSYYNEAAGKFEGVSIDLLDQISELTGLEFEPINKQSDSWSDMLNMLETGRAELIVEFLKSPDREGRFLWAENPFSVDHYALLSREGLPDLTIGELLNIRVGVAKSTAYESVFRGLFPQNQNLVIYPTARDSIDALVEGDVDYIMLTQNLLLTISNYMEIPGFKANLIFPNTQDSYFGFNLNSKMLCSIVSKAQNTIDVERTVNAWSQKTFDYRLKMVNSRTPYIVAISLLLFTALLIALAYILRVKKERGRLEEAVKNRTELLEVQTEAAMVATRAKSEFLARMSHEIRTPLNAITGMGAIARANIQDPKKVGQTLDEINLASSHLLDVLNDILDMSKIEAGKFTIDMQPTELKKLLGSVTNIISQRCVDQSISFSTNADSVPNLVFIGDEVRLRQVLLNLLGNAAKFTPPEGRVTFNVDYQELTQEKAGIRFSVSDTGLGIEKEKIPELFTAFEQANASISSKYGGTGLGLPISQSIVSKMGSTIDVESVPGEGSTFSFNLIVDLCEMAEPEVDEDLPMPDLTGKRVLLVEDIAINRIIVKELLSPANLVMDEAPDGQTAISLFTSSPIDFYDLIFMDIHLPDMNGYDITKHIRALDRPDAGKVPIIAMTANAYREDVEKSLSVGMNAHLAKPIDLKEVNKVLHKYLKN